MASSYESASIFKTDGFKLLMVNQEGMKKLTITYREAFEQIVEQIARLYIVVDHLISGEGTRVEVSDFPREGALNFRSQYTTLQISENEDDCFVLFEGKYLEVKNRTRAVESNMAIRIRKSGRS